MHYTVSITVLIVKSVIPYLEHAVVNDVVVAFKRITCHNAPTTVSSYNTVLDTMLAY
jgi:hypothetical protein